MNRRRRFAAKSKRSVRRVLDNLMSAAHLKADERVTFLNLYRWPSEMLTPEHAQLVLRVVTTDAAWRFRMRRIFSTEHTLY